MEDMNAKNLIVCRQTQDLLLASAHGAESLPPVFAAHVAACAVCRDLQARLIRLDDAAATLPVPAESASARDRFLQEFELQPQQARGGHPLFARFHPHMGRNLALAASLLIFAGLIAWFVTAGEHAAMASDGLVDRLVDWNLDLAQAESAEQRQAIFASQAAAFDQEIHQKTLSPGARVLAQKLVVNGSAMARSNDPLADAEQFTDIADLLLQRMQTAMAAGDTRLAKRLSLNYALISSQGLHPRLARAKRMGSTTLERKLHLERIIGRSAELQERLAQILEKTPDASRSEIIRELGLAGTRHKHLQHN